MSERMFLIFLDIYYIEKHIPVHVYNTLTPLINGVIHKLKYINCSALFATYIFQCVFIVREPVLKLYRKRRE
jgi:hypothetical protein